MPQLDGLGLAGSIHQAFAPGQQWQVNHEASSDTGCFTLDSAGLSPPYLFELVLQRALVGKGDVEGKHFILFIII